jgi:hypothetical protein
VALKSSHGYETESSKLFMRATVLVSDLLTFVPAMMSFVDSYYSDEPIILRVCIVVQVFFETECCVELCPYVLAVESIIRPH